MPRALLSLLLPLLLAAAPALGQPLGGSSKAPAAPSQCPDNMEAYADSNEVLTCTCPAAQAGQGAVWGSDTYTADSATCRAAVHAGILGRQGGTVTVEMLPGQSRYPGTTRNGVQSQNYGSYGASYRFQGSPQSAQAQAPAAPAAPTSLGQCPDNMEAFANSTEVVTCGCPAAQVGQGAVWGSDTYTSDSATCRAALHAGVLGRQGGQVTLEMLPGQPRYPGTTRNGVQSQNYGSYGASYRFQGGPRGAASAGPQLCPDDMTSYADSGEALSCLCPGEATLRGAVWGTDTYTADSATCRAAVHAGMIAQTGGAVSLQMLPGAARYPGTTRNGVQSQNYGAYNASYRFTGDPRAVKSSAPVQAPVAETLQRTGQVQLYITFRTNSADLDISAAPVLTQLRDALVADPALRLRLIGHTDSTGSAATNLPLSQRRAESVRQWLVAAGIPAERLSSEGRGPNEPIADNGSESGRALNRRVQAARL